MDLGCALPPTQQCFCHYIFGSLVSRPFLPEECPSDDGNSSDAGPPGLLLSFCRVPGSANACLRTSTGRNIKFFQVGNSSNTWQF